MRSVLFLLALLVSAAAAQVPAGATVTILCYHHVDDPAKNEYTVTPADFSAQMEYLKANKFNVVPMAQVVDAYRGKGKLPDKSVVITIDDGWKCANVNALPLLRQHGFPVTLFIYPAMIGTKGDKNSYEEYKEFAKDPNVSLACHSWSHPNLLKDGDKVKGEARDAFLEKEYVTSKKELEAKLGLPIKWIAYPYGLYDAQVAALVKGAGYEAAFSVNAAHNSAKSDPMFLNRIMIMKSDGMKGFTRKVNGLALQIENQTPADGAIIAPGTKSISAVISDPNVKPETVQLIMGKNRSTYDADSKTATITINGPLPPKVFQIAAQAKDAETGKLRSASWLVRVKGASAAAAAAAIARAKPVRKKAKAPSSEEVEEEEDGNQETRRKEPRRSASKAESGEEEEE